jgi:hypothetical protein
MNHCQWCFTPIKKEFGLCRDCDSAMKQQMRIDAYKAGFDGMQRELQQHPASRFLSQQEKAHD